MLMYSRVLEYYYKHQEEIPEEIEMQITPIDLIASQKINHTLRKDVTPLQRTLEYISLMDDKTFEETYENLVRLRIDKGKGYGIEPINIDEIKLYLREVYDQEIEQYKNKISGTGSRTFAESRKIYIETFRKFFEKLTPTGKSVLHKHYSERFCEYAKDQALYLEMLEKDALRNSCGASYGQESELNDSDSSILSTVLQSIKRTSEVQNTDKKSNFGGKALSEDSSDYSGNR